MSDKFCKDCKHFRRPGRCMSPEIGVDPLFGEPRGLHASMLREPGRPSGLRANWFEPITPTPAVPGWFTKLTNIFRKDKP